MKQLAKKLLIRCGYFESSAINMLKLAVPLEDVKVSPFWTKPQNKMPHAKEYQRHYKDTRLKYNILYVSDDIYDFCKENVFQSHALKPYGTSDFARMAAKLLRSENDIASDIAKDKNLISELKWIVNSLKDECINVLVNRYNHYDNVGPEAIDHDIFHFLGLNSLEHASFQPEDINIENIISAIKSDYDVFFSFMGNEIKLSNDIIHEDVFRKAFEIIFSYSFGLKNGISIENIDKNVYRDLVEDMIAKYNKDGETLRNLRVKDPGNGKGFKLTYAGLVRSGSKDKFSKICKEFAELCCPSEVNFEDAWKDAKNRYECNFYLAPKSKDLPEMNSELPAFNGDMENSISIRLKSLVGKVLFLVPEVEDESK